MSDRSSENEVVQRALASTAVPAPILEARQKQDDLLRRRYAGQRLKVADIGCGDGYHGSLFAPQCELYHGFEISPELADISRQRWRDAGLENATVFLGNAAEAELETDFYDVVWCLYFTPGNFRDPSTDLSLYTDAYLDRNPVLIAVLSRFYRALEPGGTMWLTVYKDVPEAEAAQIEFYNRTDQRVLTPPGSRFVATAERFWSARFTRRSLRSNLEACGIEEHRVVLHDLNAIAWLVEIGK